LKKTILSVMKKLAMRQDNRTVEAVEFST